MLLVYHEFEIIFRRFYCAKGGSVNSFNNSWTVVLPKDIFSLCTKG